MRAIGGLLQLALGPEAGLLSQDYGQGNRPQGMFGAVKPEEPESLFTPEEMKSARPGFMGRLAALSPNVAGPGDQYRANLDRILKMKQLTAGMAQQRKLRSLRESVGRQYALAEGDDRDATIGKLRSTMAALVQAGDVEGAGKIGEYLKSVDDVSANPRTPRTFVVDGTPTAGFVDKQGNYYMPDGEPVTGKVTPYVPPDRTIVGVQQADGSVVWTGRPEAEGQNAPSPTGKGAAAIRQKVVDNRTQLSIIADALKELNAHPDAVGLKRGIGEIVPFLGGVQDAANQRLDPTGVAARAQIANIGSLKLHDRSGAAVTISEFPRLKPFIPGSGDTPQAIRVKLGKLAEAIEVETKLLEASAGGSRSAAAPKATREQELWDAAVAKHGEAKVLQEFGPRP